MRFVGIDLAADPRRTGLAVLSGTDTATLEHVATGAADDAPIDAIAAADKAGIDVPLGWPDRFVDLVAAHSRGALASPASTGPAWRRGLAMRATDQAVHRRTGQTPLSVSTDRIAHPALRWAGLEARLREVARREGWIWLPQASPLPPPAPSPPSPSPGADRAR